MSTPALSNRIPSSAESLYRALLLPRIIEERMLLLLRQGRLAKWFSGYGQEAISVGAALALRPTDFILPTHRNLGVWTTRGVELRRLFCQLMGREGGFTKGRDRTFHFGLPSKHIIGMISHMAAMLPVACGLGLAAQLSRRDSVTLAFAGDGATREGDFHEALNLAAVWKLPVIFLVENNGYGLSTPTAEALGNEEIHQAAAGYGMPGEAFDGNDLHAVMGAVQRAADTARQGAGPTLLEARTFRMRGHEEASGTRYVPPELIEQWAQRDPVERLIRSLLDEDALTAEAMELIRSELNAEVVVATEYALTRPVVESTAEAEAADLFAPAGPVTRRAVEPHKTERRFVDAIGDGLRQAMEHDDSVLVLGQDVAGYGGVFKVTEGFLDRFGAGRVRNTPIIESGAVGAALGLAIDGYKPVIEIQYADFIACAHNQIVNNLATTHFRWGAPINVTLRAPFGGSIGAGPFHSQSMEAWYCHTPGLKVVVPATPYDAKGLLLAAIEDPNPVLFFEHKYLYRAIREEIPDAPYTVEIGKARIAREGSDATIVTWGIGVRWALAEAEEQAGQGRSIEVVDLRTLVPWDRETILASVAKTSRLLVLHEAPLTGGFGAEIAATVAQEGFDLLDAPPLRVAGADLPVPFSKKLESEIYSAESRLRGALERLFSY